MKDQAHLIRKIAIELSSVASTLDSHKCKQNLMNFDYSIDGDMELSSHFRLSEFRSKDGADTVLVDRRLIEKLQIMRYKLEKPIIVISGYRTPEHNRSKAVGGAKQSEHRNGTAADIKVAGYTGDQLASLAREVGFTGIGIGAEMCHVDVRPQRTEWRY